MFPNVNALVAALDKYRADTIALVSAPPISAVARFEQVVAGLRAQGWNDLSIGVWIHEVIVQMSTELGVQDEHDFGVAIVVASHII